MRHFKDVPSFAIHAPIKKPLQQNYALYSLQTGEVFNTAQELNPVIQEECKMKS